MAGNRKGKHDTAPLIRAAFLRGFEKYCRKQGITYSDAMANMIETEGLGYVLDRVSRFTVREKEVTGKVEHDHKHTHVAVSELNDWLNEFTGPQEDSDTKAISQDGPVLPH